ncbi:hypothetical protein QQ045_010398 [Rhodiola kirilowii]
MDPRFKLLAIEDWLRYYGLLNNEFECRIDSIKTCLYNVYDFYKRKLISAAPFPPSNPESVSASVNTASMFPLVQNFSMSRIKRARVNLNIFAQTSDLQMYLDLATIEVEDDDNFNLLGWWKNNCSLYPVLSSLAKDLLSVPA